MTPRYKGDGAQQRDLWDLFDLHVIPVHFWSLLALPKIALVRMPLLLRQAASAVVVQLAPPIPLQDRMLS